jgi:hypothetical protein
MSDTLHDYLLTPLDGNDDGTAATAADDVDVDDDGGVVFGR